LQISKDQKGDNQRDENRYQFNNIGFIDDISIFADTPEGMQKLLNVVGIDCASKPTRTLGTCHGQQQVLSSSSRKPTQVRKAHCPWQY